MGEASQSRISGIIIGVTIASIAFLLFVIALIHYYSRQMHRRKISPRPNETSETTSETTSDATSESQV
ncbi:hypothetical protein RUND412_008419 [Rhizina undulata]